MDSNDFLKELQEELKSFEKAVSTNEKDWIIKGFIDIYKNIYTISIDTKIVSKVIELLLFPILKEFGEKHKLIPELSPQQNFYPDISFVDESTRNIFSLDIKTTYRIDSENVNGMTLGAFTGYFRNRTSNKNTKYPYSQYKGHYVLGVIYSQTEKDIDERKIYSIDDLNKIPSVINNFQFFAQPKYKLAHWRPGSGNTKNMGSVTKTKELVEGTGPFHNLGENIFDDYWMFYLTKDMAKALDIERPYTNIKSYLEYKKKGIDVLKKHEKEILNMPDEEEPNEDK